MPSKLKSQFVDPGDEVRKLLLEGERGHLDLQRPNQIKVQARLDTVLVLLSKLVNSPWALKKMREKHRVHRIID